jgi:hypothetical protein
MKKKLAFIKFCEEFPEMLFKEFLSATLVREQSSTFETFIASPKGEANNRIRRKKKPCHFVCLSVCNAP